tara:strand:- start:13 stop:408 length:396 start_codon:yes stop_codon:yes gene_type:complete
MGDNANVKQEWHNTVVGEGYAARGMVRQSAVSYDLGIVVDMRGPASEAEEGPALKKRKSEKNEKKEKKEKKKKKEKKGKKEKKDNEKKDKEKKDDKRRRKKDKKSHFYPFLQLLASRISNTTREFTLNNGY